MAESKLDAGLKKLRQAANPDRLNHIEPHRGPSGVAVVRQLRFSRSLQLGTGEHSEEDAHRPAI